MASRPKALALVSDSSYNGSDTGINAERQERLTRITPRSQALIYEIQLKEVFDANQKSPSRERVNCCFRILEDLVNHAGTFSTILAVVKDELQRSVFSNGLTSSTKEPFVERIPFFSLVDRIDDIRATEAQHTFETINDLAQKVKFRDHDLQILYKKNLALKQDISDHESHQVKLKEEITRLEGDIQRFERERHEIRMTFMREHEQLKKDIEQLQSNLAQSNNIIEKLTMFKAAYNEESDAEKLEDDQKIKKHDFVVDSKGMLVYDLYQAKQLERQFAEILDFQLDDFEANLAQIRKKHEIMQGVTNNSQSPPDPEALESEVQDLRAGFKTRMLELLSELGLLRDHIGGLKMLQNQFEDESIPESVDRSADTVLRKYAGVMQCSADGGESFQMYNNTAYCNKCGAKSVICPHLGIPRSPIKLPEGCTHIKFTHPSLRIKTCVPSTDLEIVTKRRGEDEACVDDEGETEDEDRNVSKTFLSIWGEYYRARGGFKTPLNRAIPLPKLLSFIQEIYDARWEMEEKYDETGNPDEAGLPRFVDLFYNVMHERYQIPEVALKAIHDIFYGLQQNEKTNQNAGLFVLHLSGHEDVLWKYLYMAKKLFYSKQDPMDMVRYRQIVQIMYPNRPKEAYEQMELEYTAFCKNKVSRESMDDHLVHMMSTGIEPNFKFFLNCLLKFDYQKKGYLSYEDFDEGLSQILPSASTRERRIRYKLAELDCKKDCVPIQRLAHIASYIVMYSCYRSKWAMQSLIAPDYAENLQHASDSHGDGGGSRRNSHR
ncbi:hypothetical protein BC831DRAFT_451272 [Entophlyctis helioformis]|nr:hypothetical protein BC831DRAFT_451272 [Entophlyctis helioformis]